MRVLAVATILSAEGRARSNVRIKVEGFNMASNAWNSLKVESTDGKGEFSAIFDAEPEQLVGLRLCEDGSRTTCILAQHVLLHYAASSRPPLLNCDFGVVEHLDEDAYDFSPSKESLFGQNPPKLTGESKRPVPQVLRTSGAIQIMMASFNAELAKFKSLDEQQQQRLREKDFLLRSKEEELAGVRQQAADLGTALASSKASAKNLDDKLADRERSLRSKEEELASMQLRIELLKKDFEQAKALEEQLKQKNELFVAESVRLRPIKEIASNIGSELAAANNALRGQAYRIQNVQLELRGTLSSDGQSMNLAKLAELKEGIAGSSVVRMDLVEQPKEVEEPQVKVPNVVGFTESAARRMLKSAGLNMEMASKSVEAGSSFAIGQAMIQVPSAGAGAQHGQSVLVVFATE